MPTALVLVDIQNDFCEGGSLAVDGGAEVARGVADLIARESDRYAAILATADWHIDPGTHWAPEGTEPDFTHTWPIHCRADSAGAAFHANLEPVLGKVTEVFRKGEFEAAYSGFEGDNSDRVRLAIWLRDNGIDKLEVCGIATDYCVRATVLDGLTEGFEVGVITDLVAGVAPASAEAALAQMRSQGARLL